MGKRVEKSMKNITDAFSSIPDEDLDDFQSADMIQKIKKMKKKKQKTNQNITGMADFEVLTNTHMTERDHTSTNSPPSSTKQSSIFSIQYVKDLIYGKTIEGAENYFTEDEYEGRDKIRSDINLYDPKKFLLQGIETIYNGAHSVNNYIARGAMNILSNKDAQDNKQDVQIIQDTILSAELILLTYYITYNWYFLIYYARENDIIIPEFSRANVEEFTSNHSLEIFYYLFEFALWFPEKLDNILLHQLPKYTSTYLNGACQFLILYALCYQTTSNFASTFKRFFVDLLTDATGNTYINLMFAIICILIIISTFSFKMTPTGIMSAINSMFHPIWSFTKFIIRFFVTMVISVPAGAIICGIYLIIYSFFGRFMYTKTTREDIDEFINYSKSTIEEVDMCNTGGFMSWVLWILRMVYTSAVFVKDNIQRIMYTLFWFSTTIFMMNSFSVGMQNKIIFILLVFMFFLVEVQSLGPRIYEFSSTLDSNNKIALYIIIFLIIVYSIYQLVISVITYKPYRNLSGELIYQHIIKLDKLIDDQLNKSIGSIEEVTTNISNRIGETIKNVIKLTTIIEDATGDVEIISTNIGDAIVDGINELISTSQEFAKTIDTSQLAKKVQLEKTIRTSVTEAVQLAIESSTDVGESVGDAISVTLKKVIKITDNVEKATK